MKNKTLKSLGYLRKNKKTKPRSPDLVGKITIQRHTIDAFARALDENPELTNVEGNVAAG
jgi:hypothetical protein